MPPWFAAASAENRTAAHWLEQADLAKAHAFSRPASDTDGFFSAVRDRDAFIRLAAQSLTQEAA